MPRQLLLCLVGGFLLCLLIDGTRADEKQGIIDDALIIDPNPQADPNDSGCFSSKDMDLMIRVRELGYAFNAVRIGHANYIRALSEPVSEQIKLTPAFQIRYKGPPGPCNPTAISIAEALVKTLSARAALPSSPDCEVDPLVHASVLRTLAFAKTLLANCEMQEPKKARATSCSDAKPKVNLESELFPMEGEMRETMEEVDGDLPDNAGHHGFKIVNESDCAVCLTYSMCSDMRKVDTLFGTPSCWDAKIKLAGSETFSGMSYQQPAIKNVRFCK